MDIDLSNRNISELHFDENDLAKEEVVATASVKALSVARNQILRIQGLNLVFKNLVQLDLSHNKLGSDTTAVSACLGLVQQELSSTDKPAYCEGVASWIQALPATLESLNVSHNGIHSFVLCSCTPKHQGLVPLPSPALAATSSDHSIRYLRHACPLALGLFFDRRRFPRLRCLNLSHNAFAVNVKESDRMEELWLGNLAHSTKIGSRDCASVIEKVNLSFNPRLASANCFLFSDSATEQVGSSRSSLSVASRLDTLDLQGTGVDDLVGLCAASFYAPRLQKLRLDGTPLKRVILASSYTATAILMKKLLLSTSAEPTPETLGVQQEDQQNMLSYRETALCKAVEDLMENHFHALTESLQAQYLTPSSLNDQTLDLFRSCLYASVLLELIPSLRLVDDWLAAVKCKEAIITATRNTLHKITQAQNSKLREPISQSTPVLSDPVTPLKIDKCQIREGLHQIACKVLPQLHTRVSIEGVTLPQDEENVELSLERNQGWSVRSLACADESHLDEPRDHHPEQDPRPTEGDNGATSIQTTLLANTTYEVLCERTQILKKELLESQRRHRIHTQESEKLRLQLVADRKQIASQHKAILQLRAERDLIQASIIHLKKRVRKRQHELLYGVQAIESRLSTMREHEARSRSLPKKKHAAKKGMESQKRATSAAYPSDSSNRGPRQRNATQVRSVLLRGAATQRKLRAQNAAHPLSFSTSRFHKSDNNGKVCGYLTPRLRTSLRESESQEYESEQYLRFYPPQRAKQTQEAAEWYCRSISPDQRRQLRQAIQIANLSGVTSTTSRVSREPVESCDEQTTKRDHLSRALSVVMADKTTTSEPPPVALSNLKEQNLSALSLTDLFEAAAAIRHRQLALKHAGGQASKDNEKRGISNPVKFPQTVTSTAFAHTDNPVLSSSPSKQANQPTPVITKSSNPFDPQYTFSGESVATYALETRQSDSALFSGLEHVEVPSSISVGGEDEMPSTAIDALDSLNLFEGDDSRESQHFMFKQNVLDSGPIDLVSVNRPLS